MVDRAGALDLEQEAARVRAVAAPGRGLLHDRDARARLVGGDGGGGPGGAEADDQDVDLAGEAHARVGRTHAGAGRLTPAARS